MNNLTHTESTAIILAVSSAFARLANLYTELVPIFTRYGFEAPSAGVIARDLSEKIETSIVQHCSSFSKGTGHADLCRNQTERWEVKICKGSGLTINQSATIADESYIVANYSSDQQAGVSLRKIFILWQAKDSFFSQRRPNCNARQLIMKQATEHTQVIYTGARHHERR